MFFIRGYTETLKSGDEDEEGEGVDGDDGLIPSDNPPVVDFQTNVDVIEQQEIDDIDFKVRYAYDFNCNFNY